ncbi:transposable element Tcb2 transposase [Trichonephila clavipes]|nr:transposable element Tcb2 transposase [Trichonephila clavipes]
MKQGWSAFSDCFVSMSTMSQRSHLTDSEAWRVVDRIWNRFLETGSAGRRPAQGRRRATMPNEDRYLVLTARRHRNMNATLLQQHLRSVTGTRVSTQTVRNRLHGVGLYARRPMDEVEKLAYQLNEEAERTERPIRRLSKVMYSSTCADMQVDVMGECLSSIKHDVGEQLSGGSVVVGHEEPHPQMTDTLSYRPEETGDRQREKSLDTRHRRLDDRYRVLPWPEDCRVVVCLHDALYGVYL